MPSRLSRAKAFFVACTLALGGCASTSQSPSDRQVDPGPSFLIEGRVSVRRVGHKSLIGAYTWARGIIQGYWSERITITDANGTQVVKMVSDPDGVTVRTQQRSYRHSSFIDMLEKEVGISIAPEVLAGWVDNVHKGEPAPDIFNIAGGQVQILERGSGDLPRRMKIIHNETIILLTITYRT